MPSSTLTKTCQRIVVIGASGSGKTTFAAQIACQLGYPHIELDAIHWLPGWQEAPWDEIRTQVEQLTDNETWVCDGNYSRLRDILWTRADTIVWLNFPFLFVFWRLLKRTLRRSFGNVELWNGNRETVRISFFSRDSILLWLLQSFPQHMREYPQLLAQPEHAHLKVLRFHRSREAQAWLAALMVDNDRLTESG